MTQKEVLDAVLLELRHIKTHMPNGELKQMQRDLEDMKEDISDLKFTMLNPENGVIVNTNKNTDFRLEMQSNEKEFRAQMLEVENLKRWKASVNKALWIIFSLLAGLVFKILFEFNS